MRIQCFSWPSPATFIFCFSRHQSRHSISLSTETGDLTTRVSGYKWVQSTKLDVVNGLNGSFYNIFVGCLSGKHYIPLLHSADESQERRNIGPLMRSCFIGSCHVDASKRLSRSISLAVYFLSRSSQSERETHATEPSSNWAIQGNRVFLYVSVYINLTPQKIL